MPDINWTDVIGQGLQAGIGYVNQQMQLKQAKKLAKIQAGGGYPGSGIMGYPGAPMMLGYQGQAPVYGPQQQGPSVFGQVMQGLGLDPTNPQSYLGQAVDQVQGQSCQKFRVAAAQKAVPISLISDVNPYTGRMHWWRHVGQPILFSGDVSHCRRVNKLLGKATRRARRGGR